MARCEFYVYATNPAGKLISRRCRGEAAYKQKRRVTMGLRRVRMRLCAKHAARSKAPVEKL